MSRNKCRKIEFKKKELNKNQLFIGAYLCKLDHLLVFVDGPT